MNRTSEPRFGGHLVKGCEGDWIDVSSLSIQAWTCPRCRALVGADPGEQTPGGQLPPAPEVSAQQRQPPNGPGPFSGLVLLALVILAGVGVAYLISIAFGG